MKRRIEKEHRETVLIQLQTFIMQLFTSISMKYIIDIEFIYTQYNGYYIYPLLWDFSAENKIVLKKLYKMK